MYLPGLPAIAADLHADNGAVQRTLALFFVGLALGQLFYGPFSDRFGRKPPLYVGLALCAGAGLSCAFASDVHMLTLWRFLQAMGGDFACRGARPLRSIGVMAACGIGALLVVGRGDRAAA
jgi:DHA1 family bicyclomycin/chloramphenicol resistance-like MFS transporter